MNNRSQEQEWKVPTKIWNHMFISIFLANMALNLGQQMSNALLSLYAKDMGAPANQIGQLVSMFAITAIIFRFLAGPAMNSFSRKKLVAIAMSFMALAYLGFGFAPFIANMTGLHVITVMKAFRLIQGVGNAFGNSCCLTIVSDTLPKNKFITGMGYYACAQTISQAIGPTIGVTLRGIFGYNITYVIFFFVMCFALVLALHVNEAPRQKEPFQLNLHNMIAVEALIPAFITLFVAIGFQAINSFMLVYAQERGISGGSYFFTVYALTMLVTRPYIGRLTEKYGFVKVAVPSVLMTSVSLVMIGFASNIWWLLAAAFVNAFGYGAVQPMLQGLCMKAVPNSRRGSASSTNYIFTDIASLIGPTLVGYVANAFGYVPKMWFVMTIPIVISALLIVVFHRKITDMETKFVGE